MNLQQLEKWNNQCSRDSVHVHVMWQNKVSFVAYYSNAIEVI